MASKLANAPDLKEKLYKYATGSSDLNEKLTALTYAEFNECVDLTKDASNIDRLRAKITGCHSRCTLNQNIGDGDKAKKWLVLCKEQAKQNRIPGL